MCPPFRWDLARKGRFRQPMNLRFDDKARHWIPAETRASLRSMTVSIVANWSRHFIPRLETVVSGSVVSFACIARHATFDISRNRLYRTVRNCCVDWRCNDVVHSAAAKGSLLTRCDHQRRNTRLRPILMTALVASFGFVPMAFNVGNVCNCLAGGHGACIWRIVVADGSPP